MPGEESSGRGRTKVKQEPGTNKKHGSERKAYLRPITWSTTFTGKTEELSGYIYNVGVAFAGNSFVRATQELAEYAGGNAQYPVDIRKAIEMLTKTMFTAPSADTTVDESICQIGLQKEVKAFIRRREGYEQAKETYYSIAMGQCTDAVQAKLESESSFAAIARDLKLIELLRLLKGLLFNYQ
eukprot:4823790-Ditylum_brightwellii.AAC.1